MFLTPAVIVHEAIVNQEEHLSLKSLTPADIDHFTEWVTDEEIAHYLMGENTSSIREIKRGFARVVKRHPWFKAICLGDKVIGSVMLNKRKGAHRCTAELGYVLAREYWGNGYATKAVQLALERSFDDLDVVRIEAYVDPSNIGSQKVLEKNGFVREGLLENYIIQRGELKDRYLYSFLKPDS